METNPFIKIYVIKNSKGEFLIKKQSGVLVEDYTKNFKDARLFSCIRDAKLTFNYLTFKNISIVSYFVDTEEDTVELSK